MTQSGLPEGASVLIDTNPIIYVLEGSPWADPFAPIFEDIDAGRLVGVVTPITIAEIVSGPLRHGNEALAERYRRALVSSGNFSVRATDDEIAVLAARLRIQHRLKLPDAIQLATALHESCHALVTHDRDFRMVREIAILSG